MRLPSVFITLFVVPAIAHGQEAGPAGADFDTEVMLATVKVVDPQSTGTAFVVRRDAADGRPKRLLVSAEHAFSRAKGDEVTVVYRRAGDDGSYAPLPVSTRIRREGKPLWARHPALDVAVLAIEPPPEAVASAVTIDDLADDEALKRLGVHPGDPVRCVGYPHAAQFGAGPEGFGVVRQGCIASFPLLPTAKTKTFLIDLNTFEGDSGAAIYLATERRPPAGARSDAPPRLILGVMSAQHFIDEQYAMVYQSGKTRHRMGLGIIVHASAVREAIDRLDAEQPGK